MPSLYENRLSNPTANAQSNLSGRTHYVDADTLRFHKSRILSAAAVDDGLLFVIIESCAMDYHNTRRGFRYVVFDIFGSVISRVELEDCWQSRGAARKAMWAYLDTVDAKAITAEAIDRAERNHAEEMAELRAKIAPALAA